MRNMSEVRLIDANTLWELMRTYDDYQGAKEAHDVELVHRDSILFAIETAPTVDAVPVEWIQGFMDWLDSKGYTIASAVIQKMLNDFRADGERRSE